MKFLTKWLAPVLTLILSVSSMNVNATGIPVFDGAAATNMLQQIIQSKTQIDNQIEQITELKNQVSALSGSRNMGKILNTVKDQLPNEWKAVYGSVTATNYKDLLKGKDYTPEQAAKALFANYDATLKSFEDSKKRLDNIQALMTKINQTKDIKAAADLQSRIAAEQAIIQNNQTKLDMVSKLFELEEKVAYMQRSQRDACLARHLVDRNYSSCN
jgi:type IV secretion system protein VirB5